MKITEERLRKIIEEELSLANEISEDDDLKETVGLGPVLFDQDRGIEDCGEDIPSSEEIYDKQVLSLEESPEDLANKINSVMNGLLNLLRSREAKQLDDPEMRELEQYLSQREEELGMTHEKPSITARGWGSEPPASGPPLEEQTLEEMIEEMVREELA